MFNKHRLEALSDGIFAIVMTLLVLDLKVPEGVLPKHFGIMLTQQWISFLITFMIASIFWVLQHRVFALLENVHQTLIIPTFLFLGLISVLPFSTSLLGHRINEPSSFIVYFANQLLIALALTLKVWLGLRGGHVRDCAEATLLRMRLYSMCAVMAAGILGAVLLPLRFISLAPIAIGLIAKRLRKQKEDQLRTEPALL